MEKQVQEESSFPKYTLEKYNVNVKVIKYTPLLILLAISSLDVLSILSHPTRSTSVIDLLRLAFLIPLLSGLFAFIGFLAVKEEDFALQKRSQSKDYKVIFQITSRGFNVGAVRRSVESLKYWARKYLKDYEIWLVTEPDALIDDIDGVKVIKVPSDFRTNNNTRGSSRVDLQACKLGTGRRFTTS